MSKVNDMYVKAANEATRKLNELEEKIAQEWCGCSYKECSYDDKELITFEAYDRFNGKPLD